MSDSVWQLSDLFAFISVFFLLLLIGLVAGLIGRWVKRREKVKTTLAKRGDL